MIYPDTTELAVMGNFRHLAVNMQKYTLAFMHLMVFDLLVIV